MGDKKKDKKSKKKEKFAEGGAIRWSTVVRVYRAFGDLYKVYWKQLAFAYSGLLATTVVAMLAPWPMKLVLDYVILNHPLPEEAQFIYNYIGREPMQLLLVLVIGFVLLRIADSIVSYIHKIGMMIVGAKMSVAIRERMFQNLQRLSMTFHESARSGDLLYRMTSDLKDIATFLLGIPQQTVYRLVMMISHGALMLIMEWRLALAAFSVIPFLYLFNRRIGRKVRKASQKKRNKESDVISVITENVQATALIQAYGREDLQQSRFHEENRKKVEYGIRAMKLSKMFKRISDFLIAIGTGSVIYMGGRLALDQVILPGTLVLFYSYLRKLYTPLDKFSNMLLDITKAQVGAERVLEVIDNDMVIDDHPGAVPAPPLKGHIEYRDVSFSYRTKANVLQNISFVAQPGETIALIGHSGAGKSTLISLLLRFYDPQHGQILLDGHDIREFTIKSIREQMTIVMQDARLFNRSVRENIAFGREDATEEEIILAAKLAQAHEFIMQMPNGYDTEISEGGKNLSGGQKQRINIARAIIRNTPILILDEPATSLDTRTEAALQKAIAELVKGKTAFIIAHKFATIANADKILVLENGRVAGFGTQTELMKTCAPYRELYQLQLTGSIEATDTNQDGCRDAATAVSGAEVQT